jgi:hypothetical protein
MYSTSYLIAVINDCYVTGLCLHYTIYLIIILESVPSRYKGVHCKTVCRVVLAAALFTGVTVSLACIKGPPQ